MTILFCLAVIRTYRNSCGSEICDRCDSVPYACGTEKISSLKKIYTAAGTKLLIARETGNDEDFASIISLYQGYSVEFVLSPNPNAADQKLTDEQIQAGISFLSDLNFIPAN